MRYVFNCQSRYTVVFIITGCYENALQAINSHFLQKYCACSKSSKYFTNTGNWSRHQPRVDLVVEPISD